MSIRQSTPLPNNALNAGKSTARLPIQGQRITITNLVGANTLQCAIDGGSMVEIAPGFPVNTGLEQFSTVQFYNQNGTAITFDAEIGWAERPDNRTYIPSGAGLPVSLSTFSTFTPTKSTVNAGAHLDVAANARKSGGVYNDGAGTVWIVVSGGTSAVGIPVGSKAFVPLPDGFVGAYSVYNPTASPCDVHVIEFTL